MKKDNPPIDYDRAIKVTKHMLKLEQEAIVESENLLVSLELLKAWPDIFERGDFTFSECTFVPDRNPKRMLVLKYQDGTTIEKPLEEAPESYLKTYVRGALRAVDKYTFAPNELLRRRREAKQQQEKEKTNE